MKRTLIRKERSCRQVGRFLQAYLDGELAQADSAVVAAHLAECVRCGLDAHSYQWLKTQLAGLAVDHDQRQLVRLRAFTDRLAE